MMQTIFFQYTDEDMNVLREEFNKFEGFLPYNPMYYDKTYDGDPLFNIKTWVSGLKKSSPELYSLINGYTKLEDVPIYISAKNEYFRIFANWRLKIGK